MEEKEKFAVFIANKRREARLTQHDLAAVLHVSDTAVSKWERGISYPDITLIAPICQTLHITEHEFLTACDDPAEKIEKKQARHYRTLIKGYHIVMISCYAVALLACFIVNLAVEGALSWFFIVLVSILLGFCITNLPFLLPRSRILLPLVLVTAGIYALLFVCYRFTGQGFRLGVAYGIATLPLILVWGSYALIRYTSLNWQLKSAIIALASGLFTTLCNPFIDFLITGQGFVLWNYISPAYWDVRVAGNKILFFLLSAYGIGMGLYGLVRQLAGNREP